jgi:hypothetical protein
MCQDIGIALNLRLGFRALSLCGAAGSSISATATDVLATAGRAAANAEQLRNQLRGGRFGGVAKLAGSPGLTVQINSCRSIRKTGERAHDLWRELSHS